MWRAESRWDAHGGLPSTTGNYNVMGLTQVTAAIAQSGWPGHLIVSGGADPKNGLAALMAAAPANSAELNVVAAGAVRGIIGAMTIFWEVPGGNGPPPAVP